MIEDRPAGDTSPSSIPALQPWPQAPPVRPWRERAAQRLALIQAARLAAGVEAAPPYAGDPVNVQRATFGETAGDLEANRIYQVQTNQPQQAEVPNFMWPRGSRGLGVT